MSFSTRISVSLVLILLSLSGIKSAGPIPLNSNESWSNYGTISRSSEGPIEIHYANKSEQINGTRQDQIMVLGQSEISIPSDKTNWPGVKLVSGDSYLKALEYSQNIRNTQGGAVEINSKSTHVIRREFNPSPIFKPDDQRDDQQHARVLYQGRNPPSAMQSEPFVPPVQPPSNFNAQPFMPVQNDNIYEGSYGPPMVSQGSYDLYPQPPPPQDVYGVPYPQEHSYYPHPAYQPAPPPQQSYGNPYSFDMLTTMGLNWPFLKLNAITLAKILLKLVIFKLTVKFIGLICLLLFIPKLDWNRKGNGTETEERSLNSFDSYYSNLDDITTRVWSAIEQFEQTMSREQPERNESCTTIWCMVRNAFFSTSEAKAETKED